VRHLAILLLLPVGLLALGLLPWGDAFAAEPHALAVVGFNFVDTSAEAKDQSAAHATRLAALMETLEVKLAEGGKLRVTALPCTPAPCTAEPDIDGAVEAARKAGADWVLLGSVRKMSTLILEMPVQVIDLESDKTLYGRALSFRGDTDDAWQHAARFLARELLTQLPQKP
jgi:hypothetical protein